jgi:hypothetical protein
MEEKQKMKTLKIVGAILVLALVVVGATVASVLAFGWGHNTLWSQVVNRNTHKLCTSLLITKLTPDTNSIHTKLTIQTMVDGGWGDVGRWWIGYPTTGTTATPLTISSTDSKTYVATQQPDLTIKH